MKNPIKRFTFLILVAIVLTGCASKGDQTESEGQPEDSKISSVVPAQVEPCFNIFYPLALDNQWIYRLEYEDEFIEGESEPLEFALAVSELNESQATLATLNYDSGIVTQSEVLCQEGAILNFPMTILNLIVGDVSGAVQFEYISGTFAPSEKTLASNDWNTSWETEITASGELLGTMDEGSFSATLSESPVKMFWQIIGTGKNAKVEAGTFSNVVHVERELIIEVPSFKAEFKGESVEIATILKIKTTLWYEPYVGLIKQTMDSGTIQFLGIDFPIETDSILQLLSSNLISN